jgi:uncharacterized membrane protein
MSLEHSIGRLLTRMTIVGVVVLAIGVMAMVSAGISPLDPAPAFDLGAIPGQVVALGPAGILWIGLLIVIATPPLRVAAALAGFAGRRDWRMVAIAAGVLGIILLGVLLGSVGG